MKKSDAQKGTNRELIVSLLLVIGTILGVNIPLHLQCNSQIDAIRLEIKDFHGRLCAIEERNKK